MIVVNGEFRMPSASRDEALPAMARVIAASRTEAGCISYSYAEDVLEPGLFRVLESWESREALAAHFAAPHMLAWQQEREALGMTDRKITSFTVTGEERL